MQMQSLLIILVNYNGAALTNECIKSVNQSTEEADIFVVDNASRDDAIVDVCSKYDNVILYRSSDNLGFSGGNNIGIEYAVKNNYRYIMLLNNDTIIDPSMIHELMVNCNDEQISIPCMYYYDEPHKIWYAGGRIDKIKGSAKHFFQNHTVSSLEEIFCSFATGCCIMMTIDVAKKVGYLDDAYFMYCEDLDYSIRLKHNGIRIKFVPSAKLWHKVGATSGNSESPVCAYYGSRNRLYVIGQYPEEFSVTAKTYVIVTRLARALLAKLKGQETWECYIKAIKDYQKGIRGRTEITT